MEAVSYWVLLAMAAVGFVQGALTLWEGFTVTECFWVKYCDEDRHWQVISPSGEVVNRMPLESQAIEVAERWNRAIGQRPEPEPWKRPEAE